MAEAREHSYLQMREDLGAATTYTATNDEITTPLVRQDRQSSRAETGEKVVACANTWMAGNGTTWRPGTDLHGQRRNADRYISDKVSGRRYWWLKEGADSGSHISVVPDRGTRLCIL